MSDTDEDRPRAVHRLPDAQLSPHLLASGHRRIARRRGVKVAVAVVVLLAGSGGAAAALSTNGSSGVDRIVEAPADRDGDAAVVPWVDQPATPPPPPSQPTPPAPAYPPCRADQLTASTGPSGAGMSHQTGTVTLTNTGGSDCSLSGRPTSFVGVKADGTHTTFKVPKSSWSDMMFAWPADLRPGQRGGVGIDTGSACREAQVPDGPFNAATQYAGEVIGLPGGGTVTAHVPFNAVCFVGITGLGKRQPPQPPTGAYPGLQAEADLPATVVAGSTLTYTVTLTNTGTGSLALDPCPVYSEVVNIGIVHSESYRLNCSTVHAIASGDSVTYEMRLSIPAGRDGLAKFGWSIPDSTDAFAGTAVDVTRAAASSSAARGTLSGHLFMVGGPAAAGATASPLAVDGTVVATGPGGAHTATAGADGRYTLQLAPGTYTVTGTSPQYDAGKRACTADGAVSVVAGEQRTVDVYCQMR